MKYITLENLKKNFTIKNIIVGLISLTIGLLFRCSHLPESVLVFLGLDTTDLYKDGLSGSLVFTIRLAIKGVVEDIIESFAPIQPLKMDIGDILNPTTPTPQGSPQGNPQGSSQGNHQGSLQGNPQGNPPGNAQGNSHANDDWGDVTQAKAGMINGPMRVNDPLGQLTRGYDPSSIQNNQPALHNIRKALEHQSQYGPNISSNTLTQEQSKFMAEHIKKVDPSGYDYMMTTFDGKPRSVPK